MLACGTAFVIDSCISFSTRLLERLDAILVVASDAHAQVVGPHVLSGPGTLGNEQANQCQRC